MVNGGEVDVNRRRRKGLYLEVREGLEEALGERVEEYTFSGN